MSVASVSVDWLTKKCRSRSVQVVFLGAGRRTSLKVRPNLILVINNDSVSI